MSGADVLLTALALAVALLLARGSHPMVGAVLAVSALAVSAFLFLPTPLLTGWFGIDRIDRLYGLTQATGLAPPEWIHLLAFAWLGLLLWLIRKDLRNWRGVAIVAVLGVAAELSQVLTGGRETNVGDATLNALGGVSGVALAQASLLTRRLFLRFRGRSASGD